MRPWRWWFLFVATLALVLTLFRPMLDIPRPFYRYVFVFDISQSMNVDDVWFEKKRQRRLDLAKMAAWQTIQNMPCDSQAGLAIFTEHRTFLLFAPVDVCEHYQELEHMLSVIDWQLAWRSRSEITKGFMAALEIGKQLSPPARMVFFSDGHESPPVHPRLRQVPEMQPLELRGAVVGVGGDRPTQIPRLGSHNQILGYWKKDDVNQVDTATMGRFGSDSNEAMGGIDRSDLAQRLATGQEHLSSLHEDWLKTISDEAGLRYIHLDTPEDTADDLLDRSHARYRSAPTDVRPLLAGLALLLLLAVYLPELWQGIRTHFLRRDRASH